MEIAGMGKINTKIRYHFIYFLLMVATPNRGTTEDYVYGRFMGHLGNQLFQIAAATSLALDHDATPAFPDIERYSNCSFCNIHTNHKMVYPSVNVTLPENNCIRCRYKERKYNFKPIPYCRNIELKGYFQSEKYFVKYKQQILDLFSPSTDIVNYLEGKYRDIIEHPNTVAIHYRSFIKEDPRQKYFITHGIGYFQEAIARFPEDTLFVVFSNDMEKCKKMFVHIPRTFRFIEGEMHVYDFYLMSMCKHNIISNSTFSWWGAYLNKNPKKMVIAPFPWFSPSYRKETPDLIPEGWTILHQKLSV